MRNICINPENLPKIQRQLQQTSWLVACLCAQWCDTCMAYQSLFQALSEQHPEICFVWLDIEDQSELVDEIDIENFPTILIQHEQHNLFFGPTLPDTSLLERMLMSFKQSREESATSITQKTNVLPDWNLRQKILSAI